MKQQIILWISTLLLLTAGAGCDKVGKNVLDNDNHLQQQGQPNTNQPEEEPVIPTALIGSWKLAGFVRTTDNAFEEIESKDCANCYTITFLKDGTFSGYTSANEVRGKYKVDETLCIVKWEGTSANEQPEGKKYVSAMHNISRIHFMGDLLKLYYDNGQNQLLFYRKKNEALPVIPSELIGSWKLEGFGDTDTNTFREAEPKDCTVCYTLIFLRNGMLTGESSTNEIGGEYEIKSNQLHFPLFGLKTYINELWDRPVFLETIRKVDRFEIASQKLKLYYNSGKNYLRFKKVVGTTDDSMDNEIEILLDGKKAVKDKKINGLVLKFCLLNKQGKPDTLFKEGDNFTFYFSLKNITQNDIFVSADFINNDFYRVYQSNNTDRGTPWTGIWCEFRRKPTEIKIAPLTTRKLSCPWKLTYDIRPDYPFCMSESRETLPKGDYYTIIHTRIKYMIHKKQFTEDIHFKINFKIQ